ncbi:MAG: aldehyde dehydrogenase family protein [Candidatus Gracilibacteria bacterium]|nr:aldehyde dehydrogenase family protein [Candidatus Gracilibacteria bacterium]
MPKIINPADGSELYSYDYISREELDKKIKKAENAYAYWKNTSFEERKTLFKKLASLMLENKEELAKLDTQEMGMLYSGALGDVSKSAAGILYTADNFENWISPKEFNEGGITGQIVYESMGIVYTVSPWNFPYNQVFRNAAPNILAGNVVLSKHASNVVGVARKIEELFLQAGFPEGVYQNIEISASESEYIISHPSVRGTNITGGDKAGRVIGSLAGKYIKPSVLELGGSDPFILLDTSNLDKAVELAVTGRLSSCGQKCNSSKRLIVVEELYEEFCKKLAKAFGELKVGDPFDSETKVGPLAKEDALGDLETLVSKSMKTGAKLLIGGKRIQPSPQSSPNGRGSSSGGFYFEPTVVCDVVPGMSLFDEETFGPIAAVIKAKDTDHAIELANSSRFGLTAGVFTDDKAKFEYAASRLESGSVFWNKIPTSYPFLPYGGIKDSGYGRELGETGIKNFMNEKVIAY